MVGITTAATTTRSLITGDMIKVHSINSKHMVDRTIRAHDLSTALIASLQAPKGIAGHQVVGKTFSISPGQVVTGSVTVPKGKVVLSGGVKPGNPTVLTTLGSYPSADGRAWTVIVGERSDSPVATTFTVLSVSGRAVSAGSGGGNGSDFPAFHPQGRQS